MARVVRNGLRCALAALLLLTVLVFWPAPDARAHGGRIQPKPHVPGDGGPIPGRPFPKPDPRPPPPPPPTTHPPGVGPGPVTPPVTPPQPAPPPPTTPGTQGPSPVTGEDGTPTTTGRTRGRVTSEGAPDVTWEMWWELNRWGFFPERGLALRADAVTTATGEDAPDLVRLDKDRRALIRRQVAVPFLLQQLAVQRRVRDEVRAAAAIALARLTHADDAIAAIAAHACDPRGSKLVRESAAYALGMLRRGEPAAQMAGARLDAVRSKLLGILDEDDAPVRARAFAALSLGMLGDQPYGSAFTKDGRVIQRALWERTLRAHRNADVPVALLTALGMHPATGASDEIEDGLLRIVLGRRVGRRSWDAVERSHALTALVRQQGTGWVALLLRTVADKRLPAQVRRAAFIALGAHAGRLDGAERLDAAEAVAQGLRQSRDGLTRGLGQIALGRLVRADLAAGSSALVERTGATDALLAEARHGAPTHRGFSAIALALALRGATPAPTAATTRFAADGLAVLARAFDEEREARTRSAFAVALGLLGEAAQPALPALTAVLEDRGQAPALRGHAALALAQIGADKTGGVRKALRLALWDKRSVALRSQAALALSFLGGSAESQMLIKELGEARSQWVLSQVAAALGQLGNVDAVPAILALAADEGRADETRALAIASLGLIGDPEPKPSALRLTRDANYPARTDALHEAFTIL